MNKPSFLIVFAGALALSASASAQNIISNGTFDAPGDPLAGWTIDYEWTDNSYYVGNKDRVKHVQSESGKLGVVRLSPESEAGVKIETHPIPFDPNSRYTATLDVKGKAIRVYFPGYKWKPGIRPHDKPEQSELRMIYKGKNIASSSTSWKKITVEIPGKSLSDQAKKHLKPVRFITLYVWSKDEAYVDNVQIKKTRAR